MYILIMDSTEFGLHIYTFDDRDKARAFADEIIDSGYGRNIYDLGIKIYRNNPKSINPDYLEYYSRRNCWNNIGGQ